MTLVALGIDPAQADPNPIEDTYKGYVNGNVPPTPPPFPNVVYDNGTWEGGNPVPCDVEVIPGGFHTVVYPAPPVLGALGDHPVIVWGNGTSGTVGINPWIEFTWQDPTCFYEDTLKHLASFGFIVIAPNDGFVGSGTELRNAIDEIEIRNSSPTDPLYQNVDLSNIAAAGHSQGAGGAINAAATDSRIDSVLAISHADQAYCAPEWKEAIQTLGPPPWDFDCATVATADQLDVPIFFVADSDDCEGQADMRWWLGEVWLDWHIDDEDLSDWVQNPANTPCISTDASNGVYYDAVDGAAIRAIALTDGGPGHIDVKEAIGYTTSWLAWMSGNSGFAGVEDAFCGTSPEIGQNTAWTDVHIKNLPCP